MPQVIYSLRAIGDLKRLQNFLLPKDPLAARRAGETIRKSFKILAAHPHIGRLVDDLPEEFREFVIDFGDSGYVARYRIIGADDVGVVILAIRHQKEDGYH